MNKNTKFLSIILCLSICPVSVQAAASSKQIVYIDIAKISQEATEFSLYQKQIEKDVHAKAGEIEKLEKELQAKAQKLQASARELTKSAIEKLQTECTHLQGTIEIKRKSFQAYIQEISGEAEQKLVKKIREVCTALGYDIVIPGGVIYASAECDKTTEVIQALNKNYAASTGTKTATTKIA